MMFYSKVLLLGLALNLIFQAISASWLPDRVRQRRDSGWMDSEGPQHLSELSDQADALPGDDADATRESGTRNFQISFPAPLERLNVHHSKPSRRKSKEKRKRVTVPLDMIGSSLLSNHRTKKDEAEDSWEYYTE
ncbi:hypothetical protein GJAV_G00197630 [Gymnothorax javanicus]|nr:hypothetical protein GJAV_G00197630 [Gymnothorax javanicus]